VKSDNIDLEEVRTLASKGYNVTMICSAIGMSRSYAYSKKHILDTIKTGADEARQKIMNDLMNRSETDMGATASIFLAKQLKLFDEYYPTSTPKTVKEAMQKIQDIYLKVSRNELSSDKADKLVHYLEVYIKAFEVNDLAIEVEKIKEQLEKQ